MILSLLLLSALAQADSAPSPAPAAPIGLTCITDPASTSFVIAEKGDEVLARVIHHYGSHYAPAIAGIFTPNDMPILAQRAALAEKMQADTTFHWPRKNCKEEKGILQCFNSEDVQPGQNGAKLEPFALYTTKISEDSIAGHHNYTMVTLSFSVDGRSDNHIEMKYMEGQCVKTDGK